MTETNEARHREAAEYLEQHKPARDPAGEVEEVCECGHPKDWLGHRSLFLRSLVDGEPRHEYQAPARPSSPTGETPESYCDRCNYDRHICPGCGDGLPHGVEVCGHCQPTGETPTGCGYVYESGRVCNDDEHGLTHRPWAWESENGTPHGDNPNYHEYVPPQPTGETPCATCGDPIEGIRWAEGGFWSHVGRGVYCWPDDPNSEKAKPAVRPTGETAGQGVEETAAIREGFDAWVAKHGPSTAFPEYAAGFRAAMERAGDAFARATAAESENARLREALEKAQGQMLGLSSTLHYDELTQASLVEWAEEMPVPLPDFWRGYIDRVRTKKGTSADILARRALAGESTDGGAA